ncbi:MAG: 4-hydroxybenzoate octaprenyltransferase [Rickettsiales bacterium]|nr:4-hydroxybenzoate octaprenyltransferase [Rickettsiales bacterium]
MISCIVLYLETIRFFKPQGTILLFLPCLIALAFLDITYAISYKTYIIFFLGAFLVRSSACVVNDLLDIRFDKKVRRTKGRPVASGRIGRIEAMMLSIFLLSLALWCLFQLSPNAVFAGLLSPLLFTTYPLFKRFTYIPQFYLGICMSYGVLIVGLHIEGALSWDMILLFVAMVFWTFGYDTIYAYQDIRDDKRVGIKSSALLYGSRGKKYLVGSYIVFLVITLVVATRFQLGFLFFILLNILGMYILARIQYLNLDDEAGCQTEFSQNVYYGSFIYLIIVLANYFS